MQLPVAVDVMGADLGAPELVLGAERAAAEGYKVVIVGDPNQFETDLDVIASTEVISMEDDSVKAVRAKPNSSMVLAAQAVKEGKASAMISAGNTGATLAAATLFIGRLKGVGRPTIGVPLPNFGDKAPNILVDGGANIECDPQMLASFAHMGAIYASSQHGIENPKVALLSNGEERTKGSPLSKATYPLLEDKRWQEATGSTFIGNVEGRDLISGPANVIVADGFTGNIALKTLEGVAKSVFGAVLRATHGTQAQAKLGAVSAGLDPNNTGAAALLGLKGVCMISHGSSNAKAIYNGVKTADALVKNNMVDKLAEAILEISK